MNKIRFLKILSPFSSIQDQIASMHACMELSGVERSGFWKKRFAAHFDVSFFDLRREKIADVTSDLWIAQQGEANLFDGALQNLRRFAPVFFYVAAQLDE